MHNSQVHSKALLKRFNDKIKGSFDNFERTLPDKSTGIANKAIYLFHKNKQINN